MAQLQSEFKHFHEAIKLKKYEENAKLRERRDNALEAIREGLKKHFSDSDLPCPKYDWFNQGSYAMNTGVKPLDGEYDLDVGLRFQVSTTGEYKDPTKLKVLVKDVLENHAGVAEIKRPCVTIDYTRNNYHIDLAIYAASEANGTSIDYLAKGFVGSSADNKKWELSDARGFINLVSQKYSGREGEQFRRIIRYLKRWKDYRFRTEGNYAPVGIGLTINVLSFFTPKFDSFNGSPLDMQALLIVVRALCNSFRNAWHEENGERKLGRRIEAIMPVEPRDDVYDRISNNQMESLESKMNALKDALENAIREPDPHEAAKLMRTHFGDGFPVPDPGDHAKKTKSPAIVTSSSSA